MSQTKEDSGRKKVPCAHCLKEVPLSDAKVAEAALRQYELLTGGFMIRKLPSTMNVSSDRCRAVHLKGGRSWRPEMTARG